MSLQHVRSKSFYESKKVLDIYLEDWQKLHKKYILRSNLYFLKFYQYAEEVENRFLDNKIYLISYLPTITWTFIISWYTVYSSIWQYALYLGKKWSSIICIYLWSMHIHFYLVFWSLSLVMLESHHIYTSVFS